MKFTSFRPRIHLYVCCHERAPENPLGAGCNQRGEVVFRKLKQIVQQQGLQQTIWVAQTSCLGFCPKKGCSVGLSPGPAYLIEVEEINIYALIDTALELSRSALSTS